MPHPDKILLFLFDEYQYFQHLFLSFSNVLTSALAAAVVVEAGAVPGSCWQP